MIIFLINFKWLLNFLLLVEYDFIRLKKSMNAQVVFINFEVTFIGAIHVTKNNLHTYMYMYMYVHSWTVRLHVSIR